MTKLAESASQDFAIKLIGRRGAGGTGAGHTGQDV